MEKERASQSTSQLQREHHTASRTVAQKVGALIASEWLNLGYGTYLYLYTYKVGKFERMNTERLASTYTYCISLFRLTIENEIKKPTTM